MRWIVRFALAAATLAAGVTAAALIAQPASAWSIDTLPLGCRATLVYDTSVAGWAYDVNCGGRPTEIVYGTNQPPAPPTNPDFQTQLDAFINANYTAPATTTTATTTAQTTTAAAPTTTTSAPATTTDATTTAAAPVTTTTAAAPVATVTVTTTDTTTAPAPATTTTDVQTQIDSLSAQLAALAARVNADEQANAAAWQTYHDDLVAGVDPATAALDARSAGLNAIYQLG